MNVTDQQRRVFLQKAYNVRGVGGYALGNDSGFTKPNILYRADSLHALTTSDQAKLNELGIRTMIDLRRSKETVKFPNLYADDLAIAYKNVPLYEDGQAIMDALGRFDRIAYNKLLLHESQASLRQIMPLLAEADNYPVLVHCQVGKDRTGFVIGLLLSLLGVSDEVVAHDYSLSASNLVPLFTQIIQEFAHLDEAEAQQMMGSDPETMFSLLGAVREEYGSVAGYFEAVGVDEGVVTAVKQHLITEP